MLLVSDYRWRHVLFLSEFLAEAATRCNTQGEALRLLKDMRAALSSMHEVFPKETDPASDPDGFAMRRLAKALLDAVERAAEKIVVDTEGEI